jgi:hypothetical protein
VLNCLSNKNEFFKHIEKYNNAYYYLTDDTYANLPKIYNQKKSKDESYFERLKEQGWYNFYAMDWVSQINFYLTKLSIIKMAFNNTRNSLHGRSNSSNCK